MVCSFNNIHGVAIKHRVPFAAMGNRQLFPRWRPDDSAEKQNGGEQHRP